jgi:hypothetical protein
MEIKVGQIWKVTTDTFYTSKLNEKRPDKIKRQTKLNNGEFIEIRYPFDWHFRTEDNEYFHAEPDMIYQNCMYIGEILQEVQFGNKANLEEIIRLKLYRPAKM